jgi:hypothetical protein
MARQKCHNLATPLTPLRLLAELTLPKDSNNAPSFLKYFLLNGLYNLQNHKLHNKLDADTISCCKKMYNGCSSS